VYKYSTVKTIAWPFRSTLLYAHMIHIVIAGGNGPGGAAKGRIPNLFFKKKGFGRARPSDGEFILINHPKLSDVWI